MKRRRTRRTTEIELETEEVLLIAGQTSPGIAWCPKCGRQAAMASVEAAARVACMEVNAVHRLVEAGSVHFIEAPGGSLLICLASLIWLGTSGQSTTSRSKR